MKLEHAARKFGLYRVEGKYYIEDDFKLIQRMYYLYWRHTKNEYA